MRKVGITVWLQSKGEDVNPNLSALQLRQQMKNYIKTNVPIEIVRMAEEQGHKVLYTPPYHSDLQPIELVWALVKGNVGRQYNIESSLQLVYQRLLKEFENLERDGQVVINKMIESCARTSKKFYDELEDDDEVEVEDPHVEVEVDDHREVYEYFDVEVEDDDSSGTENDDDEEENDSGI